MLPFRAVLTQIPYTIEQGIRFPCYGKIREFRARSHDPDAM